MPFLLKPHTLLTISFIFFGLVGCESEETQIEDNTTQTVPIEIVTNTGASGSGNLTITLENGQISQQNGIPFNMVQEIELNLSSEGTYRFEMEDPNQGRIKIYASMAELLTYTTDNPLVLQFEHYKNQTIATFNVQSASDGLNQRRFVDLIVNQRFGSLYHIDWGDGTEEVAEAPLEVESASDRIEHRYTTSGEYMITLSTTDAAEVTGLNLQITGNGTGDKIQTLEIEDLPNLTLLSLGDNTLITIDPILQRFPNLNQLGFRFGNLPSIDLSNNSLLKILVIGNDFDTQIKGLSTLTQLTFLGVTGTIENLNLAMHPELYHVNIRGHKMSTLDVSQNPKLTTLILQLNELSQINLDANVNLESLSITNNSLSQIDLSNNTELTSLNLYANFIEELDLTQQSQLEYLDLSSVFLKQVAAPQSWDAITYIDLTNARFLDEAELLDAVFEGQANNPKTDGDILFNDLAVVIDRQIPLLQELVDDYGWTINIPE
ncbi:MAG: hypothetical protein AAGD88_10495 [Bacteroidota bacterium]